VRVDKHKNSHPHIHPITQQAPMSNHSKVPIAATSPVILPIPANWHKIAPLPPIIGKWWRWVRAGVEICESNTTPKPLRVV